MPSFYTAGVSDGTITDVKDYLRLTARALGALIHMKEDGSPGEIKLREVNDYYAEAVKNAELNLTDIVAWGRDRITDEYKKEREEEFGRLEKSIEEREEALKRYERMKAKVNAAADYIPLELTKFALQQLDESIKADCDVTYENAQYDELINDASTVEEWYVDKLERARRRLTSARKSLAAEQERCRESNEWINRLLRGLETLG